MMIPTATANMMNQITAINGVGYFIKLFPAEIFHETMVQRVMNQRNRGFQSELLLDSKDVHLDAMLGNPQLPGNHLGGVAHGD